MNSYEDILRESFSQDELTLSPTEETMINAMAENNLFGEKYIVPSFMVEAAMDLKRFEMESAAEQYIFSKYDEYTCEAFGLAESDEMKRAITEGFKDKLNSIVNPDNFIKIKVRIKEFIAKVMAYLSQLSIKFVKWISLNKSAIEKAKENQKNMTKKIDVKVSGYVIGTSDMRGIKLMDTNDKYLSNWGELDDPFKDNTTEIKNIINDYRNKIIEVNPKEKNIDAYINDIKGLETKIKENIKCIKALGDRYTSVNHVFTRTLCSEFSKDVSDVFKYINIKIKIFTDSIKFIIKIINTIAKYKPATESFDYNFFFED